MRETERERATATAAEVTAKVAESLFKILFSVGENFQTENKLRGLATYSKNEPGSLKNLEGSFLFYRNLHRRLKKKKLRLLLFDK